jgi:putative hydrolase of the HAD superfamily
LTPVRVLLLDLDHTLFDPATIPRAVAEPVFAVLRETNRRIGGIPEEALEASIREFAGSPITLLAEKYGWPDVLRDACWASAAAVTLPATLRPYPDVTAVVELPQRKVLVTTGLPRVQLQKVASLGFDTWLEAVHVDDVLAVPRRGKRAVFAAVLEEGGLAPEDVVVVGDRLESEIAAGAELGIETVHIARDGCDGRCPATYCLPDLRGLGRLLERAADDARSAGRNLTPRHRTPTPGDSPP